ncbi:hypothetical protein F4803DRAFT_557145 [Xylaria telfairii]|nr:hypothetical protein F4803DRAFT_557145 [Xylaria telfairii]
MSHLRGGGRQDVCPGIDGDARGGKVLAQHTEVSRRSRSRRSLKKPSMRAVGGLRAHDQSWRTYVVLRLEIVKGQPIDSRRVVIDRELEPMLAGKQPMDISIKEQMK